MKFNVTISSPSPLIALGSLLFNGTAVWLESALETTAAPYTVQLDQSGPYSGTLQPPSSDLFHTDDMPTTSLHRLSVQPASVLGSVVIGVDLNADVAMIVDDSQIFSLPPAGGTSQVSGEWTENQCLGSGRSDGTCHTTQGTGSSIVYTFQGDGITVWGSLENARSRYTVSIDGSTPKFYSSNNGTLQAPSVVLAHASNLGPGDHTITIFNTPLDGASRLEIDYATLYTQSSSVTSSPKTGIKLGTKIGLIVGTLGGCALIALTLFFTLLWRQRALSKDQLAPASFIDHASTYSGSMMFHHTKEADMETLAESVRSVEKTAPASTRAITPTATTVFDAPWVDRTPRESIHPMGDSHFDDTVAGRKSPLSFLARWRK